jgi:uncharacterized membrane protein
MEPWETHPTLVHFPIAFLLGAVPVDLYAWSRGNPGGGELQPVCSRLGSPPPSWLRRRACSPSSTGPASFTDEAGRLIWWHIGAAMTQCVLLAIVVFVRWRRQPATPPAWTRIIGIVAALVLVFAGYEGGYIVYHGASGIEPQLLASELREKQIRKEHQTSQSQRPGDSSPRTTAQATR